MTNATHAIELRGLTKNYGRHRGVTDLSLTVERGEIFGFLGPNGAGKSTTIRCLLGMLRPTAGSAEVLGIPVGGGARQRRILAKTGYMPSEAMFQPSLTVAEVIRFAADARRKASSGAAQDTASEAARLCEALEVDASRRIRELSLGNRKKVSIVCAFQHRPELLIFDEPTSGLDPLMQEVFWELVRERAADGAACFVSSHILPEVRQNCSRAAVIRDGQLAALGTVGELLRGSLRRVRAEGLTEAPAVDGVRDFRLENGAAEFGFEGEMPALLRALTEMPVTDLLISEPSLEDAFMNYYR